MSDKTQKRAPRPIPTDPADLAQAMFAVADKKIEAGKRGSTRSARDEKAQPKGTK